jgi:hypothetical protein
MRGAGITKPEMFPPAKLPPVPVKGSISIGRKSLCQEKFAFTQRTEGNRAGGIGAFVKHGLGPVFFY